MPAIQRLVEATLNGALTPKTWSNELARLAFARLARTEAIASFSNIAAVLTLTASGARGLTRRAALLESDDESFRATLDRLRLQINHFKKRV